MTNDEAIEILQSGAGVWPITDRANNAINKAIKALSQQTEDAISRQAVLDIVNIPLNIRRDEIIKKLPSVKPQEPSDISNDGTLTVYVDDGRKISRVLVCGANHWGGLYYPDEQEPKTGHWVRVSMDKYVQHAMAFYRCSECDSDIIGTHNYCPNCGAKMESEVSE